MWRKRVDGLRNRAIIGIHLTLLYAHRGERALPNADPEARRIVSARMKANVQGSRHVPRPIVPKKSGATVAAR